MDNKQKEDPLQNTNKRMISIDSFMTLAENYSNLKKGNEELKIKLANAAINHAHVSQQVTTLQTLVNQMQKYIEQLHKQNTQLTEKHDDKLPATMRDAFIEITGTDATINTVNDMVDVIVNQFKNKDE